MVSFKPFRAWRYNLEKVDLEQVIAPPYDVISAGRQEQLYERSPHNCIRLILNREESSDNAGSNRYTRANHFFVEWQRDQILTQDAGEAFYLYQQVFADFAGEGKRVRTSLMGRLKLEDFESGAVVPHEKTLSQPKKDRRALLEATRANFSPIFGLYRDAEGSLKQLTESVTKQKPTAETVDDEGVLHRLWKIEDKALIEKIETTMSAHKIYIADGHHRYTTSLHYAQDMRREAGTNGELLSDYLMVALVDFYDPGLVLYPTHRVLSHFEGFDRDRALESLKEYFEIEAMSPAELLAKLKTRTSGAKGQPTWLGLCFGPKDAQLLTLKDEEKVRAQMLPDKDPLWYRLDVNLINYLILKSLWKLPESLWESSMRYTHDDNEALSAVKTREAAAVFLLSAPSVEILYEMGELKELMPQKSTYFYPKMASGMLFYSHRDGGESGN